MIKLAFYKGQGNIADKAIRWWTRSKYSHVEIVIGDTWYSASPRTLAVRSIKMEANPEHWDYVVLENIDEKLLSILCERELGIKYDWFGIMFSQFLPLGGENPNRWFCSEFTVAMLKHQIEFKHKPSWYSPEELYQVVRNL